MKDTKQSSYQIKVDCLESFSVINYKSNLLNEYSLNLIIDQAPNLKEVNLTNIEAFRTPFK